MISKHTLDTHVTATIERILTMIQAIFFDIDGTLLSFRQPDRLPQSTHDALHALRHKGIKLFIATGRSQSQIEALESKLDFDFDGYVSLTGQHAFTKDGTIYTMSLDASDMAALIPYLETHAIGCHFVEKDYIYLNQITDYVEKVWASYGRPVQENQIDTPTRALTHPTYQLSVYIDPREEADFLAQIPHCRAVRWHPHFVDIIPKDGGKNKGIEKMLEHFGIDKSQTMAFGDGGNDADMLHYVEIGVAMGNACDELKALADYVTTSVDDDGICHALRHFNLIN